MEGEPSVLTCGNHAASLLASLNLQREQGQFCDCVIRQRQAPSQLYPAHRCVLAASSPVLASIVSSAGALVELQDSCLSDSVLVLVLDYIYTGALPYSHSPQQYSSLLTAACYLQMDELQESLRTAMNPADNRSASTETETKFYKDIDNTYTNTVNTFNTYLQFSDSLNSPETARRYLDEMEAFSSNCSSSSSSSKNGANHCRSNNASPLTNVSTSCSVSERTVHRVNTSNCRQVTYQTPEDLIQSSPCAAETHMVSRVDKEVQKDQFHSAGPVKQMSWQMSTDELAKKCENRRTLHLLHTAEGTDLPVTSESEEKQTNENEEDKIHHSPVLCLSTSHLKGSVAPLPCFLSTSPSSPQPCCGAVPVIRHSSSATISEVSIVPTSHPSPSVSSGMTPESQSGRPGSGRYVEDITTKHRNHDGASKQDNRNNKHRNGTLNRDYQDSSDQCAVQDFCCITNTDQYSILKRDHNSNKTDHDEHMDSRLSHMRDDYFHHDHCNLFQNHKKHSGDDSVPLNKDCGSFPRGLNSKRDLDFDCFPPKRAKKKYSDCGSDLMATPTEEQSSHSQYSRAEVSLPLESDSGSSSHYEDFCPEGGAKEAHSYTSRCTAEMDRQHSLPNPNEPEDDWYPNLHRAEKNTKDAVFIQHGHDDRDAATDNVTALSPPENENILDTKSSKPQLTLTKPVHNMSDPACNVAGQSYSGHVNYHCQPQEDTHLSHRHSDHKHSHPNSLDCSDQDDDEEEVGTFASPALSPLRQHFTTADQVLLLDISTKPAELLVSYRSDVQEDWVAFGHKDVFANEPEANTRNLKGGAKFGTDSSDGAETQPWAGETNVEGVESVRKELSRPRAEVKYKVVGVDGENQNTALKVCSPPSVPESVQAPTSSTLSVCIQSTVSANMPTNLSAHLSTLVHHPFHCSLCDRSFSQRGSLNRHVRSHLGIRPFPCPRCPMTFSRQYRVVEHMRVHQRCVLENDLQKPPAVSM